jgi:hypothetical protein
VAPRVRVVFGEVMTVAEPAVATGVSVGAGMPGMVESNGSSALEEYKSAITKLQEWIRQNDDTAASEHH